MKKSRPAEKLQETTAGQEELCLFCKIVSREMEAKVIFEDER